MYINYSRFVLLFFYFIVCKCFENNDKFINEFVVEVPGGFSEAVSVAKQMGFIFDHKMIGFDNLFVFKFKKSGDTVHKFFQHRIKRSSKVNFIEQQVARKRVKRAPLASEEPFTFKDPLYQSQWYLIRSNDNPKQFDMNVIEAWKLGYSGKGVVVSILDDGIDYRHPDLKDNYDPQASYDINDRDSDPLPNYHIMDNRHGTRCAGEVAAKANNSMCGVGVAFNSRIGAVRMLDGEVTDRVEAEALSLRQQYIDIYSGSWGPDDNGQKVEGPAKLAREALENGVKYGRKGLGNIYVWASGNGGSKHDSCACDGYASSIYTLSVSSVSENNQKPWYLESCASTLISTYSSGGQYEQKIISTDLNGKCASDHTGTSASAPLAAGIIALLLEANSNLTWRDVQYIAVVTANPRPFVDGNFTTNGANRKVSNLYGFGLMDTGKMVRLGLLWHTLPPQNICRSQTKLVNRRLSGKFVQTVDIYVDGCSGNNVVNYVEHVILYLSVEYQRRGDLQVFLTSPAGTRSEILPNRQLDYHSGKAMFDKWPLMSVQFWSERSKGKWTIELINTKDSASMFKGVFTSFYLELYGTEKFPIHLKAPTMKQDDDWFQQFERFVIYDGDVDAIVRNVYPRDVQQISNSTSEIPSIKCHNQCFNNTCRGWGPENCVSCKTYKTYHGYCVDHCPSGTYLNSSKLTCERCHYSCDKCTGKGKYNCSRCHYADGFTGLPKQCKLYTRNCIKELSKNNATCVTCPKNCSICHSKTQQCSQCQQGFVLTLGNQCQLSCDPGSYVDLRGRCRVCDVMCLTCVNGNPYECTSCDLTSFMLPVVDNYKYGKCVKDCGPSYFTNHTTRQCFRCHSNCKTCTGPFSHMCTDCILPLEMSQVTRTCIDPVIYNCKPDEYKSENGSCSKCPANCKTCTSTGCTVCRDNNRFRFNNTCVERCPTGQFSATEDGVCLSCKLFCDPCNKNVSLSYCNACYQNKNTCRNQCRGGKYWNSTTKSCNPCHDSCSACTGATLNDCLDCPRAHLVLSSSGCIKQCPIREYKFLDNNLKLCIPCHLSCKDMLCDAETGKCLQCPEGHRMSQDGRCLRKITCPIPTFYSMPKASCMACNSSCRGCRNGKNCDSCPRDYCLNPKDSTCQICCSPFSSNINCLTCIAGKEFCGLVHQEGRHPISNYYKLVGLAICLSIVLLVVFVVLQLFGVNVVSIVKEWCRCRSPGTQYSVLYNKSEPGEDSEDYEDYVSNRGRVTIKNPDKAPLIETVPYKPISLTNGNCEL